jgi:hypothetical protein
MINAEIMLGACPREARGHRAAMGYASLPYSLRSYQARSLFRQLRDIPGPRASVIGRNHDTGVMTKQSANGTTRKQLLNEQVRLLRPRLSFLQARPRNDENTIVSSIVSHGTGVRASRVRCELCELLAPSPGGRRYMTLGGMKKQSAYGTTRKQLYNERVRLPRARLSFLQTRPRNDENTIVSSIVSRCTGRRVSRGRYELIAPSPGGRRYMTLGGMKKHSAYGITRKQLYNERVRLLRPRLSFLQTRPRNDVHTKNLTHENPN